MGRGRDLVNHAAGPLPQEEPPTNAAMRLALSLASEVAVVDVGMSGDPWGGTARFTVTGDEVAGLAQLLAIVDGGTGDRCRCWRGPALLLRGAAGERVAQWTLHLHQDGSIRGVGNCDAELRDGPGILHWLAGHGLSEPLEAERRRAHEAAGHEERRAGWVAAAPAGLPGPQRLLPGVRKARRRGWLTPSGGSTRQRRPRPRSSGLSGLPGAARERDAVARARSPAHAA